MIKHSPCHLIGNYTVRNVILLILVGSKDGVTFLSNVVQNILEYNDIDENIQKRRSPHSVVKLHLEKGM